MCVFIIRVLLTIRLVMLFFLYLHVVGVFSSESLFVSEAVSEELPFDVGIYFSLVVFVWVELLDELLVCILTVLLEFFSLEEVIDDELFLVELDVI